MDTSKETPVSPAAAMESTMVLSSAPAPTPAVNTAPGAATAAPQARPRASLTTGAGAVVVGVSVGFIVAMLALARYPSPRTVPAAAITQADAPAPGVPVAAAQPDVPPAAVLEVAAVAEAPVSKAVVEKARQARVVTAKKSLPADPVQLPRPSETVVSAASESAAVTVVPEPTTSAPAAESNQTLDLASQGAVTISGCLEMTVDGGRFRLTDTEGVSAPKARSWRSGFLNKRRAPVELVDVPEASDARKYVGHRVAATGLLTSRELRVRSLESAGASCE